MIKKREQQNGIINHIRDLPTNKVNHFQSLGDGSRKRFLYGNSRRYDLSDKTDPYGHEDGVR